MTMRGGFAVKCCMCGRVRSKKGVWYKRSGIPGSTILSHTYCPRCARTARMVLAAECESATHLAGA